MEPRRGSFRRAGRGYGLLTGSLILAAGCQSQQISPGMAEMPESAPALIDCPEFMPPRTGERGLTGARLRVQVGTDGRPMAITPIQGPNDAVLEEATRVARGCVFEPALEGGEPVTAWTRLVFEFREVVVRS